jgi:hypothetical protein
MSERFEIRDAVRRGIRIANEVSRTLVSIARLRQKKQFKLEERRNAGLWREMQNRANSVTHKLLLGPNRKYPKREMRRSTAFLEEINAMPK